MFHETISLVSKNRKQTKTDVKTVRDFLFLFFFPQLFLENFYVLAFFCLSLERSFFIASLFPPLLFFMISFLSHFQVKKPQKKNAFKGERTRDKKRRREHPNACRACRTDFASFGPLSFPSPSPLLPFSFPSPKSETQAAPQAKSTSP